MLPDRIAVAIIKEGKILLVQATNSDFYITPGGKIESGESHQDALARELREELGVQLKSIKPYLSYKTTAEKTGEEQTVHCYLAEIEGEPIVANEIKEYQWFDKQNLPKLAKGIQNFVIPKLLEDSLL